jgi:diguanylate cyclase (GGDEF)-like protein/PAS domain S-box-containing protein
VRTESTQAHEMLSTRGLVGDAGPGGAPAGRSGGQGGRVGKSRRGGKGLQGGDGHHGGPHPGRASTGTIRSTSTIRDTNTGRGRGTSTIRGTGTIRSTSTGTARSRSGGGLAGGSGAKPAGLAVISSTGRVVLADRDMALRLGLEPVELLGQDLLRFVDERERPAARQALRRAGRTGRVLSAVWWAKGASGRRFRLVLQPWQLVASGASAGEYSYLVTVRSRAKPTVTEERQALLAAMAEESEEAMICSGQDGLIQVWNRAAEELFGWNADHAVGANVSMLVPPERESEASELLSRAWAGEVVVGVETVLIGKDGARIEVSVSLAPLRDRSGHLAGVSHVVRDITKQKAQERALAYQALHDPLTGLPNRTLLEDRMAHALERCRRKENAIGVIFFDLDHLKTVNDTAGHQVGDDVLRAVASRLRQSLRTVDTVARMGGDEFVVLCEDISNETQLDTIVSHVMAAFSEPVVLVDRQVWVSMSAGMVLGGPSSSVTQLLSQADAAMYQAKERARGSVARYDPSTRTHLERKAEGSRLLHLALEARHFVPYYQPVVDLHTGVTVGAEALVRWEDPLLGISEAKDFVPLAEELGLIADIGEGVLSSAAMELAGWRAHSPSFTVAVNVSALQLRGGRLLSVAHNLIEAGADPTAVVLEITESALMEDAPASASVLSKLRDQGFGIAIDDFGTGYSSLAYLKRLPATSIKVDRVFTSHLPEPQDLSVVMAILAIADSYGLSVVAEGIEAAEQATILRELGCPQGQGYYFGKPVPAAQFGRAFDLSIDVRAPRQEEAWEVNGSA